MDLCRSGDLKLDISDLQTLRGFILLRRVFSSFFWFFNVILTTIVVISFLMVSSYEWENIWILGCRRLCPEVTWFLYTSVIFIIIKHGSVCLYNQLFYSVRVHFVLFRSIINIYLLIGKKRAIN